MVVGVLVERVFGTGCVGNVADGCVNRSVDHVVVLTGLLVLVKPTYCDKTFITHTTK